jgi:predicted TIM-barrel fold metal-dependent hydrolase
VKPPPGSCDAHTHVFDTRFAAGPSPYALPVADLATHAAMRDRLGTQRAVLVQPAPYGRDPACMLDALAHGEGRLRGVMIADETITDATLEAWHAAGIRALRFVEMQGPSGGGRYPGSIGFDSLRLLAPRLRALGWQAHLWASAAQYAEFLPGLLPLGVPLVLDHFGMPEGPDDPAFASLLPHLRDGNIWVKLTLCRVRAGGAQLESLRPLQDSLVAANADRLLWGSDWPYVRMDPPPDARAMLNLCLDWLGDAAMIQRILVDNPRHLFGFD